MILVDTSVWIDFLRGRGLAKPLAALLDHNQVLMHPWIIEELRLGHLGARRQRILEDLGRLPISTIATLHELGEFVEREKLFGKGLSFVDVQLLVTAIVEEHALWTCDKVLARTAQTFHVGYQAQGPGT